MDHPLSLASTWFDDQPKNAWTPIDLFCAMPSIKQVGGVSGISIVVEKLAFICMLSVLHNNVMSMESDAKQLNFPLRNIEKLMKEDTFINLLSVPNNVSSQVIILIPTLTLFSRMQCSVLFLRIMKKKLQSAFSLLSFVSSLVLRIWNEVMRSEVEDRCKIP